jgi:hypothetical protein
MKKRVLALAGAFAVMGGVAMADWFVDESYKMHEPQLPDISGWDVDATNYKLADDWRCTETGAVSDIHFWVSSNGSDAFPEIGSILVGIYSDLPAPPQGGFSTPGTILWERSFSVGEFFVREEDEFGVDRQGWWDPADPANTSYPIEPAPPNHTTFYQVNIEDIYRPWVQEEGTIYWLAIQITQPVGSQAPDVGWKSSEVLFNDLAVFYTDAAGWIPLDTNNTSYPKLPHDLAFVITPEPTGAGLALLGCAVSLLGRRRRRA